MAQSYFWHRFYSHQPSLNYDNPTVRQAMLDVVDYWKPLLGFLEHAVNERFLRAALLETLLVERSAESLLDRLGDQVVPNTRSPASPSPGRM